MLLNNSLMGQSYIYDSELENDYDTTFKSFNEYIWLHCFCYNVTISYNHYHNYFLFLFFILRKMKIPSRCF